MSPSTTRRPAVLATISSTLTPGARSRRMNPRSGSMSSTARSVTTFLTQPTPVRGSVHSVSSLDSPSRLLCCMATMMFSALATRSMAPPMPLTMRPGIFQLAMSPRSDTSMAPSTVSCTLRARIMPKEVALSNSDAPASAVMVCFPALIRSASSSPSKGKGPMPRIPFSD